MNSRMRRAMLLGVGLALAGCGGAMGGEVDGGSGTGSGGGIGTSFDREALSGTRLKQRYLQGDDGSRTPQGFFDTTRSENCAFTVAEDGEQRCIPIDATYLLGTFFYDSACTERVGYAPQGSCPTVKYGIEYSTQCPAGAVVYGATLYTPTMATLFGRNASSCNAVNPATFPTFTFYRIGGKVPASSFARAVVMVEP